jgi:hypothetical protein
MYQLNRENKKSFLFRKYSKTRSRVHPSSPTLNNWYTFRSSISYTLYGSLHCPLPEETGWPAPAVPLCSFRVRDHVVHLSRALPWLHVGSFSSPCDRAKGILLVTTTIRKAGNTSLLYTAYCSWDFNWSCDWYVLSAWLVIGRAQAHDPCKSGHVKILCVVSGCR